MRVTLLGPQRTPTLGTVVRSLRIEGPVATVTAGWREREPDDGELDQQLDGRSVNLALYRRWLDVLDSDPDYAAAAGRVRETLAEVQDIYLSRLGHALLAVYDVQRHAAAQHSSSELIRADAVTEAIAAVRELDARHLRRISDLQEEFYVQWPPHERPVIAHHRAEVARLLRDAGALVVTGGHVGDLVTVLHLFNVAASLHLPVIAWSAGAMALADRIVLFHDRSPIGPSHAEVYGSGLSLLRAVVPLPHASARLLLADAARMSVFARRFAPARCLLLESGTRVDLDDDRRVPVGARVLAEDGRVTSLVAA